MHFISFDTFADYDVGRGVHRAVSRSRSGASPTRLPGSRSLGGSRSGPLGSCLVTYDEIKFIFQVAYQLLYRITDLDLVGKPFQAAEQDSYADYGSQAEVELLSELYGAPPMSKEQCDSRNVVQRLQDHPDI